MKKTIFIVVLLTQFTGLIKAQSTVFTVSGKVTSFEESIALKGVRISVKGTNNISATLSNGTFAINVSPENKILVFEYKDYETKEVVIKNEKRIDMILQRDGTSALLLNRKEEICNGYIPGWPF